MFKHDILLIRNIMKNVENNVEFITGYAAGLQFAAEMLKKELPNTGDIRLILTAVSKLTDECKRISSLIN